MARALLLRSMALFPRISPSGPPMILAGAVLVGCTGSVMLGASGSTTSGTTANGSTGSSISAGSGGNPSTGSSASSAGGATSETCEALEMAAVKQLDAVVQQNLACSVDADCTEINVGPSGDCAAPCGVLTDESGAEAVQSAANSACKPFLAAGCKPPILECPAFPPFVCVGGTCAAYSVAVTPSPLPTFTLGVCTVLHLAYSTGAGSSDAGSPDAHSPIGVLMQSSIGTVYADAACTMPVTTGSPEMTGTLTIPAGTTGVDFGFMPDATGSGSLNVGPGIGGSEYGITVQ
jgi:hypothetical protein